jgi:hypothetical protein
LALIQSEQSTADVLANITGLVLRSKFNLDTDQVRSQRRAAEWTPLTIEFVQVGFVNHSVVPMDLEYLLVRVLPLFSSMSNR